MGVRDHARGDVSADHRAFLDATLPHLDIVYRVARHIAADPAQADDLVQETYLRAFAGFAQHVGPNTRAWLVAICMNVARSEFRRQRGRPKEELVAVPEGCYDPAEDIFDQVAARLDKVAVIRALSGLPEPQRICLVLMDLAGHTAAETAEILGCPRGTVLARVHRGRRRLAQLLVAEGIQR